MQRRAQRAVSQRLKNARKSKAAKAAKASRKKNHRIAKQRKR